MSRTDASGLLAAERQEPLTAAEHAAETGHQEEHVRDVPRTHARDVPRTCNGAWQWNVHERCYELLGHPVPGCPWHTESAAA
jgi:hypothetical protein